jgi:hypothetical protein
VHTTKFAAILISNTITDTGIILSFSNKTKLLQIEFGAIHLIILKLLKNIANLPQVVVKLLIKNIVGEIMPEISRFLGIVIKMYWAEHNPPHFHAEYNEFSVEIEIETLTVKKGKLPARILGLVIEWAELHQKELLENWNTLQTTREYHRISPLI